MNERLDAEMIAHVGGFEVAVALSAAPGETVAVVGPNGAGKTTLVRALAGLLPIEAGHIRLGGTPLDEPSTGVFVPAEARPIGVVFQDHRLFPHLSALDNVAFGLRCRRVPAARARQQARAWLERVGVGDRASAKPAELSGGQAQRVAVARALAIEPELVLLDEPFAALDATTRVETRRDLRRHLRNHGGVRVLVTHDALDAAALAERIVVLEEGRVVQEGTLDALTAHPRSRYVADLVGMNMFAGRSREGRVDVGGLELLAADRVDGDVLVTFPPRAVTLSGTRPEGSPRNVWTGGVDGFERAADRVRVRVVGPITVVAEITVAAAAELGLAEGGEVWVAVKATELEVARA